MKATIYDIAKEAGVSITTVSQVINGKGKISEERRNEIFRIMERLRYQPSVIAAALTGKKTYTLGLIVPDISNPFFAELARAVEDQGHRSGYSLMICSTDNKDDRVQSYLNLLQKKSVDGIIVGTGMDNEQMLNPLVEAGIPIVLIAREMPSFAFHTVIADDWIGGTLVARHLLGLGHVRTAILAENPKVSSSRNRIRGFRQALEEAGLSLPDDGIRHCDYTVEDGKRQALELLGEVDGPTALFCCNDLLAIGALQAAKERELKVPEQLSVVGFDNTILASVTDPPLTTVAQPIEQMGNIAVDLLMQELSKKPMTKQRVVLRPELVVRQSAASPE